MLDRLFSKTPADGSKPIHGVPAGLDRGYLGAYFADERVHCVYDASLLDPAHVRAELAAEVGAASADAVVFVASAQSAARLAEVWRNLGRGEWLPPSGCSYAVHMDIWDGVIEMVVEEAAFAEVRPALEELGRGVLRLRAGTVRRC